MNLKMRLERLCDKKCWTRLHFADGTTLTGRVLRVGMDYIELECYGEADRPLSCEYSKHLVPLPLVKYITVDSTTFADAERNRLNFLSSLDYNKESLPEIDQ